MRSALEKLAIKIDPTFSAPHHLAQRSACGARTGLLPLIAIAWSAGSAIGLLVTQIGTATWLLSAAIVALTTLLSMKHLVVPVQVALFVCFLCVASARAALDRTTTTPGHATLAHFADGRIVSVRGTISSEPQHLESRAGRLEQFGHVPSPIMFNISAANITWPGAPGLLSVASIRIFVHVEEDSVLAVHGGDRIHLRGRLRSSRRASNPGAVHLRTSDSWIDVPGAQLLELTKRRRKSDSPSNAEHLSAWRMLIRSGLDRALSNQASPRSRALVNAIVLGIRTRDFDEMSEPYRRTGLAHYLAVSGFALGVLVAIPALLLLSASPLVRGVVVAIVVTLGMLAIDLRAPALRAGVVACAAALGSVLGRDWNRNSLLALAALILLLIDPMEILRAGFQLSFAVVAALLLLAPVLSRRLQGPVAHMDGRLRSLPITWMRTAIACGVVAWCAATPIVLHHFGILSPAGIALSILAAPIVVTIVAFSIGAIVASLAWPALASIPAMIAAWSAEFLDNATLFCAQVPGACFVLPSPSFIWVLCAELLLWRWVLHVRPAERTVLVVGTLLLVVFFVASSTRTTPNGTLEMLTLDVGNGSCHVVSGPGGSILVDAGSSSIVSCARRVVMPALRMRGIESLEAIVITHANLDHYAAAGDLISRIPIGTIILGESFIARARSKPSGPAALFLRLTNTWNVPVVVVSAGDSHIIGGLRWRFLHPRSGSRWMLENDSSLVVRVEHLAADPDEPAALLFTGDIEEEAMRHLMEHQKSGLRACILEAPHHGSVRRSTKSFIEQVDPFLIIQSSGSQRLQRDEFGSLLESRFRAVTARSGAIHIRHVHRGTCEITRFWGDHPITFRSTSRDTFAPHSTIATVLPEKRERSFMNPATATPAAPSISTLCDERITRMASAISSSETSTDVSMTSRQSPKVIDPASTPPAVPSESVGFEGKSSSSPALSDSCMTQEFAGEQATISVPGRTDLRN